MKSKHLDRRLQKERIQDSFILPEVYAKYRKMVDASFPNLSEEEKDVEARIICHTHPDSPHVQKPAPDPKLQPGKPTSTQKLIAVLVAGVLILLQMVALLLAGLIYVLIFSDKAHAAGSGTSQIDVIKATDGTHTVIAAAPFKISFSGCTVGGTGSAWTINCTGGAANPGGTAHQVQVNLSGTGFAGIANGTAGQVLCSNGTTNDPSMCDPVVSGPDAVGTASTKPPVQVAGNDGTNVRAIKTDTSGNTQVIFPAAQHVIVDTAPTTPVTGTFFQSTQPVSIADGSDTTLGAKADAKSTATDTTAITLMQVLKEISAMEQAPASRAVINAGTFATQASQSGTWTVQPGNTANSTPWLFNINDGTNSLTAALSAYGTAPTGTKVLGVNSFITNIPHVVCDSGCSSSTAPADASTFTESTTSFSPIGGYFRTSPTSLTTDHMGAVGMTASRHLFVNLPDALPAGTNVIGHVIADSGSTTAVTGNVAVTKADGSDVTLGAKADAKSTATDTTAVTIMQVLKEISAMEQAPASRAVTNAGTFAVQASGTVTTTPPSNASTNVTQWNGTTVDTNSGTKSAGTVRVVLATDQPALTNKLLVTPDSVALPANQSVNVNQVSGAATSATNPLYTRETDGTNAVILDPCRTQANIFKPISQTASAQLVTGTSAKKIYICSINLVTAGANNVAMVEGTGSTCATGIAGMAGGTTAATGWNFAANGGLTQGNGMGSIMAEATNADNLCLLQSAAVQLSGVIGYVVQ